MDWKAQLYMIGLKIIIFGLLIERYKLKKTVKAYKSYLSKSCIELSVVDMQLQQLEKNIDNLVSPQ